MNTRDSDGTEVLTPTESRQASPRTLNFKVLVYSLAALAAIGIVLLTAFSMSTSENMDASSGPQPTPITTPAPAAQPTAPAPTQTP